MAIDNKHEGDTLVLEITNGHKEEVENLVEAYKIKDGDEAKLIAYLLGVASHESVIGSSIGANGRFFSPPDEWVEKK